MALIPYPLAVVYSTGFKDVGRSTLLLVAGPGRHLSELLQLLLEVAGGGGLLVLLGLHLELAGTLCSTGASAIHFGEVHLKESRILVQCAEAGPAGHRRRIVQAEAARAICSSASLCDWVSCSQHWLSQAQETPCPIEPVQGFCAPGCRGPRFVELRAAAT
eukprot:CAMPEP_0175322068 /NCGR_PEP_ID=MMETSP0093-20121207/72281_1 /TAXON_ID=311494 /ORGANISM="Alexandrium monilatum, Strain CCMP3105" /LENGTH=160 /DNA_ID=CAMNT_0016618939 /DNA_START=663 /DNA_END=1143 /DNA_ORIENTATION=-